MDVFTFSILFNFLQQLWLNLQVQMQVYIETVLNVIHVALYIHKEF